LRFRRTDLVVREAIHRFPLSVSFDKLGATAARWAHLADELAATGHPVDRTGAGGVAEVYPAAARLRWGLGRERSMAALIEAAPWLGCGPGVAQAYDGNEHAFDALIAALAARAVAKGLTARPVGEDAGIAAREGWIHLPDEGSLRQLP
jgi:predicted nuclease with RNAse H fold